MNVTAIVWIVVAALGAVLLFFLGWRWASRVWSLPCPTLLAWVLDSHFYERITGTEVVLRRMGLWPGQRVLEVGAGTGRLLVPAAQRVVPGGEAVGSDIQAGMVERLKERAIGLIEPAQRTLVANLVAGERKGLAYDWYNSPVGVATLPSSLIFGALYHVFGALAAFGWGAALALVGVIFLTGVKEQRKPQPQ